MSNQKKILVIVEGAQGFDRGRPSNVSIDSIGDTTVNLRPDSLRGRRYDSILIPETHALELESIELLRHITECDPKKIHLY